MVNHFLAKAFSLFLTEHKVVLPDCNIQLEAKNGRSVPSALYGLHGVVLMQRDIFMFTLSR